MGRSYHLTCDYRHFSVPHSYAGWLLGVRRSSSRVTAFDAADIVCEHAPFKG